LQACFFVLFCFVLVQKKDSGSPILFLGVVLVGWTLVANAQALVLFVRL
jgi:hypothetical protein